MSTQRDTEAGNTLGIPETRSERIARKAIVLSRGIGNTRLTPSNLPPDMTFQWMPDDPNETARMELLGFVDGSEYIDDAKATHKSATGIKKVGDVRCWVIPKEEQEINEAAQQLLVNQRHGLKEKQWEESSFMGEAKDPHLTTMSESTIEEADAAHIRTATALTTQ